MEKNIFEVMENDVMSAELGEEDRKKLLKNIMELKNKKVNLMITGATGSGKSSTINALFDMEVAKVGVGVDPETMDIKKYELDNLVLWDSPGLGDGKEADERHAKNIIEKLYETDENGDALIDLVLVILDGSTRDLGTSYQLINNVIIPNLGKEKDKRILVAINQADVAMKGKYWDEENNEPMDKLKEYLEQKVKSVKARIKEGTGIEVEPIYYSAGFKEEGMPQQKPYNLSKLLYYIVKATPVEKRLVYVDNLNREPEMWEKDDKVIEYEKEVKKSFMETVKEYAANGAEWGRIVGGIFGKTGEWIGGKVGGTIGVVVAVGKKILDGARSLFGW